MLQAKGEGLPTFLVGHVTKDGSIAGPRVLEHMVDTVLYFEGDPGHPYRILRAVKNRFGSTNEIGVFEMQEQGLREVSQPFGTVPCRATDPQRRQCRSRFAGRQPAPAGRTAGAGLEQFFRDSATHGLSALTINGSPC